MEREKQERAARRQAFVSEWHFQCADGAEFSAIAASEEGALRVLNAERPGVSARFVGRWNIGRGEE